MNINELEQKAKEIRQLMVCTLLSTQRGHPGGSFSSVDILTALYFSIMNVKTENPEWEHRDRFILSKGHASLALYSALAVKGYFDKDLMLNFRGDGSILSGHPDMVKIPGVDMSTGSLGQGLSVGAGMALAGKYDNKDYNTYVLIGDGESQEGQIWEAVLCAAQLKLDNLIAIIDRNYLQLDGPTEEIMKLDPMDKKWESFGWRVINVDGHDMNQIINAFKSVPIEEKKPTVIIADTIKGKGLTLMENKCEWHGMKFPIKGEHAKSVLKDVGLEYDN
ncbi:transketolase [bacterium]